MSKKVVVICREPDAFLEKLASRSLEGADLVVTRSKEEAIEVLPEAEIVLAMPVMFRNLIEHTSEKLKWVQSYFAGVDALLKNAVRQDYVLTCVKEVYGEAMAEYVMAYLLSLRRRVSEFQVAQKENRWAQKASVTLQDQVIGILGTGSIGSVIAGYAKQFGMRTIGFNRSGTAFGSFDEIYTDLETFLPQADYVVSVLPSTPVTRGLADKKFFSTMKASSYFINVGRGDLVVEEDIIEILTAEKIAGAVLDVFKTEPLPEDNPLWSTPNLHVTPHVSGYVIDDRIFDIFEDNYNRYISNQPLKYEVDFERGY